MELRPELMPPALDGAKVQRLAEVASKLDGYNSLDVGGLLQTLDSLHNRVMLAEGRISPLPIVDQANIRLCKPATFFRISV